MFIDKTEVTKQNLPTAVAKVAGGDHDVQGT